MRKHKGFTLVEILIVVVILGILAAIVIPQFSDASTQSKVSSSLSSLQTLRSQIQLYKIQHNDNPPLAGDDFATSMTLCSDADATVAADFAARTTTNRTTHPYGPYMQSVPANPWNGSRTINASDITGVGWVYLVDTGDIYLAVSDVTNTDVTDKLNEAGATFTP